MALNIIRTTSQSDNQSKSVPFDVPMYPDDTSDTYLYVSLLDRPGPLPLEELVRDCG